MRVDRDQKWTDSSMDALEINAEPENGLIYIGTSDIGFNIESLEMLDEIIERLQKLRDIFE